MVLFELGWIGDTIVTIPAMRCIRAKFPEAEIIRVCSPIAAPILRNCPYIDKLLIYDKFGTHHGIRGKFTLLHSLINDKLNFFVNLHTPDVNRNFFIYLRDNLFSYMTRAEIRVGYYCTGTRSLLTHGIKYQRSQLSCYIVDLINQLTMILGCQPSRDLELWITAKEKNHIFEFLKKIGVKENDFVVAIHPGAKRPSRRWPVSRFIEITKWLTKDAVIIVTGGKEEIDLACQITAANKDVIIASGMLTIMQTAALISRCNLFISNDTGIMHMAFALKVPTVALFGPGNVKRWVPPNENFIKIIHHPVRCSPCYKWDCEDLSCLKAITVDEVKGAILELVK